MAAEPNPNELVLRVRGLRKQYTRKETFWRKQRVPAVDGVDFELPAGKTLALVGSSGSGKSTIARCVTRLERPDAGEIWLDGEDIAKLDAENLRPYRTQIQMVFQDATTAINPRFTAADVIQEPLLVQRWGSRRDRQERASELMKEVGLSPEWAERRAMDFSGGQRQRLAIARALALKPKLLVLDEAFTGLDLSTQAQIANLLLELQATHSLAYLLISHDLGFVSKIADTVAVISSGRIVEIGPTVSLMSAPRHAETQALLTAARVFQKDLALALGAHA